MRFKEKNILFLYYFGINLMETCYQFHKIYGVCAHAPMYVKINISLVIRQIQPASSFSLIWSIPKLKSPPFVFPHFYEE